MLLFVAIPITLIVAIALSVRRKWITHNWPPSPIGLPIVGNIFQLATFTYKKLMETSKKLGTVFCLHFGSQVFVVINDWKSMKEVFVTQADNFSQKYPLNFTRRIIGVPMMILIDGIVWREKRRFIIQHLRNFGFGKSEMETVIKGEVSRVCEILDNHMGKKPLEVHEFFFRPALNVIWGIIAGTTYEYDDAELNNVMSAIKDFFIKSFKTMPLDYQPQLRFLLPGYFPIKKVEASIGRVKQFIEHHIDEHRKTFQRDHLRDYIDSYLLEIDNRRGSELKGAEICYQHDHLVGAINDLFIAGIETSMATMEWALLYMILRPDIQLKVQKELDDVIGRNREPNYSDSKQLPYTRATILEILRCSTSVPLCSPRIAKATTTVNGLNIPKGASVVINLHAVNNDPAYWSDPEVFRPTRFLNDQGQVEKPEFLIPFSTGARVCPGESIAHMELFLMFTSLIQRYTFRSMPDEAPPTLEPVIGLTRAPKPFHLIVDQRI